MASTVPNAASNVGRPDVHVALLRGINVGGKHRLPMKALIQLFEQEGCSDVQTYIQSGNVVFHGPTALARRLPARLTPAIHEHFGFEAPIFIRTAAQLEAIARYNPFLKRGVDTQKLHVGFLAKEPTPRAIAVLDPDRSPPDTFRVEKREIYLHCPNGMGRTKFTNAYLDSKLGVTSTIRNWRTVLKLVELTRLVRPERPR